MRKVRAARRTPRLGGLIPCIHWESLMNFTRTHLAPMTRFGRNRV